MSNSASGIDEILQRWRREIKGKTRRIISFEETAEIKINALKARIYPIIEPLHGWQIRGFRYTRQRCREFVDSDWRPIRTGEQWGGPDMSALFKCSAKLPASMKGRKACLRIYFGGDGLLSVNGAPYHGLDPFRDTVLLADPATGNETFDLEAECYIMWHFGESETKTLEISQFAVMDQEMRDTYWDFRAAWNVMTVKDLDQDAREFIKAAMAEAILPIDQNEACPETFRRNAGQARAILRKRLYETDRFRKSGLMHLNGNSHLDVVFLWTHAEFVRKLGRTHATALRLLEQYPDYKFSQSQALMYREMKETYPAMFEQVKAMVKAGRWEIVGATWVEPDCNLISGESFVRQILHGMNFIKREFGVTPRTFWCPDVFGNTWTMPQIIARSGLKYFVTHKMGVWNDTNPWTKNTFWWQGPDGTRVLSLMPPTHFIGTVEPDHMAEHWSKFSDKATIGESLYNFGWGDGGGGPDVEMLEYLKRYREFPGVTPTRSSFVDEALDSIAARARDANIPVWNDELYLEEHRGTFTTKARLKKANRKCELLYRKAEIWALFSSLPYPAEELDAGWKEVLTNQFHDSLPGSHITPVYHDLCEAYERAIGTGERITRESLSALAETVDTQPADGEPVVVFNSLAFERDSAAALEWGRTELHVVDSDGNEMPHQFVEDAETGKTRLIFEARDVPSLGYRTYWIRPGAGKTSFTGATVTESLLENDHLRAAFNKEGEIVSLIDKKTGRECIDPDRRGNVFKLYEDVPGKYEAWDIAPSYTDVEFDMSGAELRVDETGPVRSSILVTRNFRKSRMVQRIILGRSARRLDFETWIDWKEQQKLLKVRFFTTVVTRKAAYDIPFGVIERNAHRNTSYDEAKFEVPAHFWMDLSQQDFGLSLLNDCKYGHEASHGMMALSLLRGPINPDPVSDQEEHRFVYSLYPHAGGWVEGETHARALDLNDPVESVRTTRHPGALPPAHSFLSVTSPNVAVEALKKAETGDRAVVRIVERQGATAEGELRFASEISDVKECDLLERDERDAPHDEHTISFTIRPWEIKTFKLTLGQKE